MPALPRRAFLAAAGAAATPWPARAQAAALGSGWILPRSFLEALPSLMRLGCLPGLAIAVIENGQLAWNRTYGVSDAATKEPVTAATLFEAASTSKPVFAYAMLQLADRKIIDLDRPLAAYFKPAYMPDDPLLAQVTARHVLTHSSGLPNWADEEKPDSFKPAFKPGTGFCYSGEGFFWLQQVAEQVTGFGLDKIMRTQLFEPAGMADSSFAGDAQIARRMASGHLAGRVARDTGFRSVLKMTDPIAQKWNKPLRDWTQTDWVRAGAEIVPKSPPKRVRFTNSAASLITTAADYAKFLTLLMEKPLSSDWEISAATRRAMIAPQNAVQKGTALSWGLGWAVEPDLFSHEGSNEGRFVAYVAGDSAKGRGIVILTNSDSGAGISHRIMRAASGRDPLSFIAALNPPVSAG